MPGARIVVPVRVSDRARRSQRTEVQRAVLLAEAGPGHDADARRLEQLEAVERIGRLASVLGRLERLVRQADLREQVERALGLVAADAVERLEAVVHLLRARGERLPDRADLAIPQLVARLALLGRSDEDVDADLTGERRAELDRGELVDLVDHLGIKVDDLEVAASSSALRHQRESGAMGAPRRSGPC